MAFNFIFDPLAQKIVQAAQGNPFQVSAPSPLDGAVRLLDQVGKGLSLFAEGDVVPVAEPSQHDPPRKVFIACHPVGPFSHGDLYRDDFEKLEKALGKPIPDPTYHWAVIIGDYYHELNPKGILGGFVFAHIQNGYQNGKLGDGKTWSHQTPVGFTKFNDAAIVAAGRAAIQAMPEAYNVISNNCQTFVIGLVHLISPDANLSDVATINAVIKKIKESDDEDMDKHIDVAKTQNVPAVNAATVMQSITTFK